jgi:hypothetical protein
MVLLHGHCFDGTPNMSGSARSFAVEFSKCLPINALFVYCFAHSLNLSIQNAVWLIPFVRDSMHNLRDFPAVTRRNVKRLDTFRAAADGLELRRHAMRSNLGHYVRLDALSGSLQ